MRTLCGIERAGRACVRLDFSTATLAATAAATLASSACARRGVPPLLVAAPFAADSGTVGAVAPGVLQRSLYVARGPWAIHLLDVDPSRCWTLAARKAFGEAIGRAGTLALARELNAGGAYVAGAVNADFFLFVPPGVPTGLHVEHGALITGPVARPAVIVDSAGAIHLEPASVVGTISVNGRGATPLAAWNRGSARGVALFDPRYGPMTDSAGVRRFAHLAANGVVTRIDSGTRVGIEGDTRVLTLPRDSSFAVRVGDTVRVEARVVPHGPRDAVSGRPMLVRDSAVASEVDTTGDAGFRGRNPRTAVGIRGDGRLLLVVVDGRQPGYSEGMSLRELADFFLAAGATQALNLDGGGSSTLVARTATTASGSFAIVNRPSDAVGERPVANALAVVRGCGASRPSAAAR